jgi:YidC/Oxa1 family membrane protein insertase
MYIVMAGLFVLVMGYYVYVEEVVRPKHPEWDWSGQNSQIAPESVMSSAGQATSSTQPGGMPVGPAGVGMKAVASTQPAATAGQSVWIGSQQENDPDYALGVQVSPAGAGLDSVVINDFKSADAKSLYSFQEPYGDGWRAMAVRSVTVNGANIDLSGLGWTLESSSATTAVFGADIISSKNVPLLHLTATYRVEERGPKKNRDNTAAGFEMDLDYGVRNLGRDSETVRVAFDGPTMPPRENERQDDRQVLCGYDKGDQTLSVVRYGAVDFKPGSDTKDLTRSSNGYRILWGGVTSLYFSAIVRPENEGQFEAVSAAAENPQDASEDRVITLNFQTADLNLAGGGSADVPLKIFLAPKERGMLEGDYYSAFPRGYNQLLVSSSGICGMCAFSWLVDFLVWLLSALKWVFHDWGLAIIALVMMVRLLLHPITKHSMVSTMKMQKMGPELERLKKKFGDDKDGFQKAQVQLYKEMGFTPVLGCLPMFLQMPIWIALYSALQTEIELRQARFLWGLTWIHDLARPDRLITWDAHAFTLPVIGLKIAALNVLPILMGIGYFMQQKFTPKPPAMTPEAETQQKTMQWMTLLFPLFLYNAPSGLNLYILTSGAVGALENKRIRDHIKQRDEAEKAGKVIVGTRPTRQGKQQKFEEKEEKKPRGIAAWWARLQEKAEEMRREAEKRKKKK